MLTTSPRSLGALLALVFVSALVAGAAHAAFPDAAYRGTLRIRLLENLRPTEARVQAARHGLAVYGEGQTPLFTARPGESVYLSTRNGDLRVRSDGHVINADAVRIEPMDLDELSVAVGGTSRSYAGVLEASVSDGLLKLVNYVPLEEYVASVVASEYGLNDLEGSKAMAVIARTYGLAVIRSADDTYDHVDNTASQVYRGSRAVTPLARRAAEATQGEVLMYRNALIEAVYSSSSGGYTANNEDIWQSSPHPYLRGRRDPWDRVAPHHAWTYSVSRDALHKGLEDRLGRAIEEVRIAARSSEGRATQIELKVRGGRSRTLSATEFRSLINAIFGPMTVKSTFFDLDRGRRTYDFKGRGFGHGVGLSQWGAHGMAQAGKSYREILDFYYTDVRLERLVLPATARARMPVAAAGRSTSTVVPDRPSVRVDAPTVARPARPSVAAGSWTRPTSESTTQSSSKPLKKRRKGW